MKRKTFFFLLGFAFFATALFAGGKTEQSGSTQTNSGVKTLEFWVINLGARQTILEQAVANFNKANPDINVKISVMENDPYKTKLVTAFGSGAPPDIFHSWGGGWLQQFVDVGHVLDISKESESFKGKLNDGAMSLATFDEKIYGIPYTLGVTLVFYNKQLFQKYRLTYPKTFAEMQKVSETFLANGITPFAMGNQPSWPGALEFIYYALRLGGGETFVKAVNRDGATFEDPSYIQAGQVILDNVAKKYYPQGANGINYDTGGSRMLLYTDRAAMMVMTAGLVATTKMENPDFYNNKLAVGEFWSMPNGKGKQEELLGGGNVLSVSSKCAYPKEAMKFIEYITTDPELSDKLVNEGGTLVPYKNVKINDPIVAALADITNRATYVQNYYDQAMLPALAQAHLRTTQALFGASMTAKEAARQVEEKAKEIYGK